MHHRADGFAREQSGVVNDPIINTLWEIPLQFLHLRPNPIGSVDGVRTWKLKDDHRGSRFAVKLRRNRIIARGKFDASHVPNARDLTLRTLLDDDVAELLFIEQSSLRANSELKIISR